MMKWDDVNIVITTIIENKYNLLGIDVDEKYRIEKITDSIFELVRSKQLNIK